MKQTNSKINNWLDNHQKTFLLVAILVVIVLISVVAYNWYLLLQATISRNIAIENQKTESEIVGGQLENEFEAQNTTKEPLSQEGEQVILMELQRDNIKIEADDAEKTDIRNELSASSSTDRPPLTSEKRNNILEALQN